jgi:hypothetical protein
MEGAFWSGFSRRPPPRLSRGWSHMGWQSLVGAQLGINLDVVSPALAISTGAIMEAILHITGNI